MKIDPEIVEDLSQEDITMINAIHAEIKQHDRTTALLRFDVASEAEGPETRYGGRPWMKADEIWPKFYGEPMAFVGQVNLEDVPGVNREGTLLVFIGLDGYEEGESACAILTPKGEGSPREDGPYDQLAHVKTFITSDYPHDEELEEMLPPDLLPPWNDGVCDNTVRSSHFGKEINEKTGLLVPFSSIVEEGIVARVPCFHEDKLGGWPAWMQASEWPQDDNGNPMLFIAQLGEEQGCTTREPDENSLWGRVYVFADENFEKFSLVQQTD